MSTEVFLKPETLMPCRACGVTCQVGVRTGGQLVLNCPEHGVTVSAGGTQRSNAVFHMDPEERLWVLETAVRLFLVKPEDGDFLVVQSMTLPCNYVQLRYDATTLWAEVCSRQWDCPHCGNRPLPEIGEIRLSERGFTGGGHHRNYESKALPRRPGQIAHLLDTLLVAAFDEPMDFAIAIYPKRVETLQFMLAAFAASATASQPG